MLVFVLVSLGVVAGAYMARQTMIAEMGHSTVPNETALHVSDLCSLRTLKKMVFMYETIIGEKSEWHRLDGDYAVSYIITHKPGFAVAVLPNIFPRDFFDVLGVAKTGSKNIITVGAVHEWKLFIADAVKKIEDDDVD